MLSERVYRWLLIIYPSEHRRNYGDLMVQLFLDRMRWEGNGFRGLFVWSHMVFDLVGAAFKEHKEGADMKRIAGIGIVLAVLLVAGGIGAGVLLAQSDGEVVVISTLGGAKTFTGTEIAETMRQAVEDGAIGQEAADELMQAFEDGDGPTDAWRHEFGADGVTAEALRQAVENGEISQATADSLVRIVSGRIDGGTASGGKIFVMEDARTFSGSGGVAETLHEAVQTGAITQGTADEVVLSLAGGGSADVFRYEVGDDGVAGAVQQAVEDGVISQALAELILSSAGVQ